MTPNNFKSVEGKTAIVTGAASGIGRAIAQTFAANGMNVIIADVQDESGEKVAQDIRDQGGQALFCHTDVTREEDFKHVTQLALEHFGQLHVMVNNAGVGSALHPLHEFDTETFRKVADINYIGTFMGMKYAVKAMLQSRAHDCSIINIASANGLISSGNYSLYDSTKGAVIRLTQASSLDYAEHDITVNAVCPGVIGTEIYQKLSKEQLERSLSKVPMRRMGKPEEIAYMVLFLASDMARFITGSVITVDAGQTVGQYLPFEWETPDPRKCKEHE